MTNHFLNPPFSLSPAGAKSALHAAIDQGMRNAADEGLPIQRDEIIAAMTSGADWWESVEATRALVAKYRARPRYQTIEA